MTESVIPLDVTRTIKNDEKWEFRMQPVKASITLLYSAPAQYLIPVFQRGDVWTLEKQVAPLWADLEDCAQRLVEHKAQALQVGASTVLSAIGHSLTTRRMEERFWKRKPDS